MNSPALSARSFSLLGFVYGGCFYSFLLLPFLVVAVDWRLLSVCLGSSPAKDIKYRL